MVQNSKRKRVYTKKYLFSLSLTHRFLSLQATKVIWRYVITVQIEMCLCLCVFYFFSVLYLAICIYLFHNRYTFFP